MNRITVLSANLLHVSRETTGKRPPNAVFKARQVGHTEWDLAYSGCLDAPNWIPAGSTGENPAWEDPHVVWSTAVRR